MFFKYSGEASSVAGKKAPERLNRLDDVVLAVVAEEDRFGCGRWVFLILLFSTGSFVENRFE
jgi:hypothetical protein